MNRITVFAVLLAVLSAGVARGAGVVAHYELKGDVSDSSDNGFDGVNVGDSVTFVDDPDRGMVAQFDGTAGSVNVSASGYSITERPNFQFAISFWIKPDFLDADGDGVADVNVILGATGSGAIEIVGDGSWYGMGDVPAYGGVGVNSGGGAGSTGKVVADEGVEPVDLYDGDWHHVVIQWVDPDGTYEGNDAAHAEVYLDNTLATPFGKEYNGNSKQASPTMVLGGPVVWSDGGAADKYYAGLLSDVYFFDGQLTAEDVNDLFTPPGPELPGDADGNGYVDDSDLSLLLASWGKDTDWAHGEFNGAPPVDDSDLSLLLANWTGASPTPLTVPEPATLTLLALGAVAAARRRRR